MLFYLLQYYRMIILLLVVSFELEYYLFSDFDFHGNQLHKSIT